MMNDYTDLSDEFQDLIDNYTGEFGAVVDLDAWSSDDLMRVIRIMERILEMRGADYGSYESDY